MNSEITPPNGSPSPSLEASAGVSLTQRAYTELKQRILSGALAPGTLLSERQLALSLKMSKTPVHAALERLQVDGLVTVAAQQGIVVRAISPQEIADHFEIRQALETFVVKSLAGRLTLQQAGRLRQNLREQRRAIKQGDLAANIRLDYEFHLMLCEFHGNAEITRAMSQISDKIHGVIHQITSRFPERTADALSEHEAIAEALVAGDGAQAAERIVTHLRNGLESLFHRHPRA